MYFFTQRYKKITIPEFFAALHYILVTHVNDSQNIVHFLNISFQYFFRSDYLSILYISFIIIM